MASLVGQSMCWCPPIKVSKNPSVAPSMSLALSNRTAVAAVAAAVRCRAVPRGAALCCPVQCFAVLCRVRPKSHKQDCFRRPEPRSRTVTRRCRFAFDASKKSAGSLLNLNRTGPENAGGAARGITDSAVIDGQRLARRARRKPSVYSCNLSSVIARRMAWRKARNTCWL